MSDVGCGQCVTGSSISIRNPQPEHSSTSGAGVAWNVRPSSDKSSDKSEENLISLSGRRICQRVSSQCGHPKTNLLSSKLDRGNWITLSSSGWSSDIQITLSRAHFRILSASTSSSVRSETGMWGQSLAIASRVTSFLQMPEPVTCFLIRVTDKPRYGMSISSQTDIRQPRSSPKIWAA